MRTYDEAILWIAKRMFHQEMGGGQARNGMNGVDSVAYIFDKHWADVEADVMKKYAFLLGVAARNGADAVNLV